MAKPKKQISKTFNKPDPNKDPTLNFHLKDWRADYEKSSSKVSELFRSTSYSLIATIWIFNNKEKTFDLDPLLLNALKYIIIGLSIDIIQYLYKTILGSIMYDYGTKQYEKGKLTDEEIKDYQCHPFLKTITWIIFWIKLLMLAIAFISILNYFKSKSIL